MRFLIANMAQILWQECKNTHTTLLQIKLLAFTKKSYVRGLYAYFKFPFICSKYIYSIYREEKVGNK
jgi:hypothetical protein